MESFAGNTHQVWSAGDVPVGVNDLRMPDVRSKRSNGVINRNPLLIEALDAVDDKGMPHVLQTVVFVVPLRLPFESFT